MYWDTICLATIVEFPNETETTIENFCLVWNSMSLSIGCDKNTTPSEQIQNIIRKLKKQKAKCIPPKTHTWLLGTGSSIKNWQSYSIWAQTWEMKINVKSLQMQGDDNTSLGLVEKLEKENQIFTVEFQIVWFPICGSFFSQIFTNCLYLQRACLKFRNFSWNCGNYVMTLFCSLWDYFYL